MNEIIQKVKLFETETLKKSEKFKSINRLSYQNFENINFPVVGITGLRGVGKTTYLLKKRKEIENSIYISCDRQFLISTNISELLVYLYKNFDINYFILDEIQFFPNRQSLIKNIFDVLDAKILFSGSSKIKLEKLSYDLSRRVIIKQLYPFSFGEYINYKYKTKLINFETLMNNYQKLSLQFFNLYEKEKDKETYLSYGEFGYYYQGVTNGEFSLVLDNSLKKSIYEDIPQIAKLDTGNLKKVESLIVYLCNMGASEINISKLSQKIGLDNKIVKNYLIYLENLGWVKIIDKYGNVSNTIRKEKKIYLLSNNLMNYLSIKKDSNFVGKQRETFFLQNIIRVLGPRDQINVKSRTDFVINKDGKEYEFEIGGKSKKRYDGVFVIKDNINIATENEIPIWLFGFLY